MSRGTGVGRDRRRGSEAGPTRAHRLYAKDGSIAQVTSQGELKCTYAGASLWDMLAQAKVIDPGKGAILQRTVTVTAPDGYAVVMSLSEINPDYGNNDAIIGDSRDGAALVPVRGCAWAHRKTAAPAAPCAMS